MLSQGRNTYLELINNQNSNLFGSLLAEVGSVIGLEVVCGALFWTDLVMVFDANCIQVYKWHVHFKGLFTGSLGVIGQCPALDYPGLDLPVAIKIATGY